MLHSSEESRGGTSVLWHTQGQKKVFASGSTFPVSSEKYPTSCV